MFTDGDIYGNIGLRKWQRRSAMDLAPRNRARAYLACLVIIASVAPAPLHAEGRRIRSAAAWLGHGLNRDFGFRGNETIFAAYYQAKVFDGLFLQPVLGYIPNPRRNAQA